ITHMPQIATYANLHYTVFKETEGGRTFTRVNELKGDAVVEEFARMLGGTKVTDKTREHARDIYDGARIK
ncbi:MAG: DNA repair protein RecN, partial [Thermodesulfobacteriota bacterium]